MKKKMMIVLMSALLFTAFMLSPQKAKAADNSISALEQEIKEIFLTQDNSTHNILRYKIKSQDLIKLIVNITHDPEVTVVNEASDKITRKMISSGGYVEKLTYSFPTDFQSRYLKLRKVVNEVTSATAGMSNVEKLLFTHDYIITNCAYGSASDAGNSGAYNTLVLGHGICGGYTDAMTLFCDVFGITCKKIDGNNGRHIWLQVELDGQYYHIDATWDDPCTDVKGRVLHNNFLVNDSEMYQSGHYSWTQPYQVNTGISVVSVKRDFAVSSANRFSNWFVHDVNGQLIYSNNRWFYVNRNHQVASMSSAALNSDLTGASERIIISGRSDALTSYQNKLIYSSGMNVYACNQDGSNVQFLFKAIELVKGKYNVIKNLYVIDTTISYKAYCYEAECEQTLIKTRESTFDMGIYSVLMERLNK